MTAGFSFKVVGTDSRTKARAGLIKTPHGKIKTPAFSPVATRASVRALGNDDLEQTHSQVILANTYHLYLKPGVKIIRGFGGFAPFMSWQGPTITDSGGYQVSFLWTRGKKEELRGEESMKTVKITDEGVEFQSYFDGSLHFFTPEKSMVVQKALGADLIMAFDQPQAKGDRSKKAKEAFERTLRWAERSFAAWQKLNRKGNFQALYGVVQGDVDEKLRRLALDFVLKTGFPGIALGGEAIGADPKVTALALDRITDFLPENKPVHALGLGGGPEGIFEAVKRGIDTFDNTGVTRLARTGLLFIYPEDDGCRENKFRLDIRKKAFEDDKKPVSKICRCYLCRNFSRAYIHHLFSVGEILGLRLATIHNVFFINELLAKIRSAILTSDFGDLEKEWL